MIEITIPATGVAMTEALILKWLKQPGEEVEADEPVVEIETDKATAEIVSPGAGRLGRPLFEADEVALVGAVITRILEGDEVDPGDEPGEGGVTATPASADADQPSDPSPSAAAVSAAVASAADAPPARRESPRARAERAAAERGAAAGGASDPSAGTAPSRFRRLIAAKTLEAWRSTPHFAVSRRIDAEPLLIRLADGRAAQPQETPRLTVTDLLLAALAGALAATGDRGDIAVAVATDRGVVNPVLAGLSEMSSAEIASVRHGAVTRAREGRLEEGDLGDATSTLSNLGTNRVDWFTGIITPGQRTLLTVGSIDLRPWVDDEGRVIARKSFEAILTADHQVLDGADSAQLLDRFADGVLGVELSGRVGDPA